MADWTNTRLNLRYHWKRVLLWGLSIMGASIFACHVAHAATLGIPGQNTTLSGIGVISGWKCHANGELTVRFNGGASIPLLYGAQRPDVLRAGACAHDRVGFLTVWNWGELGNGTHTAVVYDDGMEFDRSTFTVVTAGTAFLRGTAVDVDVPDFPTPGRTSRFVWNEGTQHLELAEVYAQQPPTSGTTGDLSQFAFLIDDGAGDWEIDIETVAGDYFGLEDVSFLGYRTTATGRDIMVGHYEGGYGVPNVDFALGHPADVLPRLPSFHGYRYALVLPLTSLPTWTWLDNLRNQAASFCLALLFNRVEKDRYGDINMPVTGIISARDGGICVPENGAESLIQPTTMNLEIALD